MKLQRCIVPAGSAGRLVRLQSCSRHDMTTHWPRTSTRSPSRLRRCPPSLIRCALSLATNSEAVELMACWHPLQTTRSSRSAR